MSTMITRAAVKAPLPQKPRALHMAAAKRKHVAVAKTKKVARKPEPLELVVVVAKKPEACLIKPISFSTLRDAYANDAKNGMVFMGTGGDVKDWIDGIHAELLRDCGIPATIFESEHFTLTTSGGRDDLVFKFTDVVDAYIPRLAMWRLRFGGCSWLDDYLVNYAHQHY